MDYELLKGRTGRDAVLGTGLLTDSLPKSVNEKALRDRFGKPLWDEMEKGEYGPQWCFRSSNGDILTLYSRHGMFRIGGHSGTGFRAFLAWLVATLGAGSDGKVTSKKAKAPKKRAATKAKKKAPARRR